MTLNKTQKVNLLNLNHHQIRQFFKDLGEKSFHADQVMKWIYSYHCDNFNEMTDIKISLREKLSNISEIYAPKVIREEYSIDGTIKWTIAVDKQQIETIYIPEHNRATLCISSQIGCPLKCKFCLTARQGFNRNLHVFEIIGQIWRAEKIIKTKRKNCIHPITNIVMMGMGEPLLNLENVISSIKIMLDSSGFNLSKRHITLSTSGIVPALDKLRGVVDVVLAISLHAPNNKIRNNIVPINRKYNIESLLTSARHYLKKSNANKGRVTIEYVMLDRVNDRVEHAYELVKLLKSNISCKINLIPWNFFHGTDYKCSSNNQIYLFYKILAKNGFVTTIRRNRGSDIYAACGQLSGKTHINLKL